MGRYSIVGFTVSTADDYDEVDRTFRSRLKCVGFT